MLTGLGMKFQAPPRMAASAASGFRLPDSTMISGRDGTSRSVDRYSRVFLSPASSPQQDQLEIPDVKHGQALGKVQAVGGVQVPAGQLRHEAPGQLPVSVDDEDGAHGVILACLAWQDGCLFSPFVIKVRGGG